MKPKNTVTNLPHHNFITRTFNREDIEEGTMKKTHETYFAIVGEECLTIEVNLEVDPPMYRIPEPDRWRTKEDWIKWWKICLEQIDQLP